MKTKMGKIRILTCGGCVAAFFAWISTAFAVTTPAARGYDENPETLCLSNAAAFVRIAPAWGGRVIHYGPDEKRNYFWQTPNLKTLMYDWFNPGGEKTWIGPQKYWVELGGLTWPPPAFCDSDAFFVKSRTDSCMTLQSRTDAPLNMIRRIELLPGGALRISVSAKKNPNAATPLSVDLKNLQLWSVAQLPAAKWVQLRLTGQKRVQNGGPHNSPLETLSVQREENKLFIPIENVRLQAGGGKCFADADEMLLRYPDYFLRIRYCSGTGISGESPVQAQFFVGEFCFDGVRMERYSEAEFAAALPGEELCVEFDFFSHE